MNECIVAFTDLYLPTVNGVTYTVNLWRTHWSRRHGRMAVVYPRVKGYTPGPDEFPIASIPAPLYAQYRLGIPLVPAAVPQPDVVHVHTPFTIGIAGLEVARHTDVPVVGSYHTLLSERVPYVVSTGEIASGLQRLIRQYVKWFYDFLDLVITPSTFARRHLIDTVGIEVDVEVVSNGIDTTFFRPVDPDPFVRTHGLADADKLVGYTGRHSPEKNLVELIEAVSDTDLTLVLAGDGPIRISLEERARAVDADVRFLGFLDYEQLPAFYSALDVFAFPSPTETQGLVALEANACGTPVVAVDEGALSQTVIGGETGYHYSKGDRKRLQLALYRALDEYESLRECCLRRRSAVSVDHSMDQLAELYERVRQ